MGRIFRNTVVTVTTVAEHEATPSAIIGHLWCSSGADDFYINQNWQNSITALYLTPVTSGYVFGVGSTYELWGVRN
jgi:hypothetical protein